MNLFIFPSHMNLLTSQVAGFKIKKCKTNNVGYKTNNAICQFSMPQDSMPKFKAYQS